ncbi:MAG TPA: ABC transporter permease, partial [Candidatus Limnocylindria bacterium]|nr:ABC transporter permease [Candidatus Limnocylindria bacterium]
AAVVFLCGLSFTIVLRGLNAGETDKPITELFYPFFLWLILLLASPVITMRSFAQEKYSGTFETLMTTPVSDLQVVLAKFSGAMFFYLLMWSPLLACIFVVRHFTNEPTLVDPGTLGSTLVGITLLGALYVSLGCFASSLSRSQIIAAMIAVALGVSLYLLSFLSYALEGQTGWLAKIFSHVSLNEHMQDFARGVIDTRPVIFYLSLTVLFLFLTLKSVESRRWKS